MSALGIYSQSGEQRHCLRDFACIAATLNDVGIRFERWPVEAEPDPNTDAGLILQVCQQSPALLNHRQNFSRADLIRHEPGRDHPHLRIHRYSDDRLLFCVGGNGLCCFHLNDQAYLLLCGKGDLIGLPAGTPHWFDADRESGFKYLRFYNHEKSLAREAGAADIAGRFPDYESFRRRLEVMGAVCPV